jgi:hypothetical protein
MSQWEWLELRNATNSDIVAFYYEALAGRASKDKWPYHPKSGLPRDLAGLFQIKRMRV